MQVVTTRDENDGDLSFVQVDEVESNELVTERWTLQSIASELWTTDYEQLFNIEIERNRVLQSSSGTSGFTGQQELPHTSCATSNMNWASTGRSAQCSVLHESMMRPRSCQGTRSRKQLQRAMSTTIAVM